MLISRYPVDAPQEWIDASEKEIVEWKIHKRSRRIELNGCHCAIGPMKMETPSRPNSFRKFLTALNEFIIHFDLKNK
jgi:hypothetical protein